MRSHPTSGLFLRLLIATCCRTRRTMLCLLLANLVPERQKIPRRSSPILPWLPLEVERNQRRRYLWKTRLWPPTLSLNHTVMPKLPEMITLPVLENLSESTSQPLVSLLVVILYPTFWKSPVLLNSKKLRGLTTSSISCSSPTEMVSVMEA